MKIYDITKTIDENMVVYKNLDEKRPIFNITKDHENDGVRETTITIDVHTGTHLDAPLHMVAGGRTIDKMLLEPLIGNCKVIDFSHIKDVITREDLIEQHIEVGDILLFKTQNSFDKVFNFEFIYLGESGAKYLAKKKIKGVGIDGLGIERSQSGHKTHHILFEAGIYIIEGLELKDIKAGVYELIALPLKLKGLDASPVRAILTDRRIE